MTRIQPPPGVEITRHFQRYDHLARADRRSSHRLGHRQREAVGEFFYVASNLPDIAFPTRGQAVCSAVEADAACSRTEVAA